MKIAYLSHVELPSRRAGSVHVMRMCAAFAANGHDVTLYVPRAGARKFDREQVFRFYGVEPEFRIQRYPVTGVKLGRHRLGNHLPGMLARLRDTDLIYSRCHARYACHAATKFKIPFIFEMHVLYEDEPIIDEILASSQLQRVVLISDGLRREFLERHTVVRERTLIAHDAAVLPGDAEPVSLSGNEVMHVGYIGHLYAGRGIETIGKIARQCEWARFHLVGGTEKSVAERREEFADASNITFHGFVPPSEVDRYRATFDALIAPYRRRVFAAGGERWDTARWMSPLKIFEYMASGVPMLASDLPTIREVLTHDANALLCDPDDIGEWCAALARLRDEPDLSRRLAAKARSTFEEHYTWRQRARAVLAGIGEREPATPHSG